MFKSSHWDNARRVFADQFERDGNGFLYRKGMKGPPIRVSEAERDAFIRYFDRRLRLIGWSTLPASLLLVLFVVWIASVKSSYADPAIYIGLACLLTLTLAGFYQAWSRPAHELERRAPEGNARSPDEMRRLNFTKMTYGRLALAAVAAPALVLNVSAKYDVMHGWGILWLFFAGGIMALAGIQAFRKWRYERTR